MSMNGIDIYHGQNGIDLSKVPCDFVIMKATQGTKFVDPCCDKFYQTAKKLGKKLGVYHYYGGGEPIAEADHFVNTVKGYIGEAILVLDWEQYQNAKYPLGAAVAKPFLDRVYELTGVKPLIYMSKSVCRGWDWNSVVDGDYGLWVAQYANKNPTGYKDKPWTDNKGYGAFNGAVIHQYASTGRLNGYNGNLDLDIAYMDAAAWDKYAKPNKKVEYYPVPQFTLVECFDKIGVDSSFANRAKIAAKNNIADYKGTAEQNYKMLQLLVTGKLIKP